MTTATAQDVRSRATKITPASADRAIGMVDRTAAPSAMVRDRATTAPIVFTIVTALIEVASAADQTLAMPLVGFVLIALIGLAIARPRLGLFTVFGICVYFEASNGDPMHAAGEFLQRDIQGAFGLPGVQFT